MKRYLTPQRPELDMSRSSHTTPELTGHLQLRGIQNDTYEQYLPVQLKLHCDPTFAELPPLYMLHPTNIQSGESLNRHKRCVCPRAFSCRENDQQRSYTIFSYGTVVALPEPQDLSLPHITGKAPGVEPQEAGSHTYLTDVRHEPSQRT